MPATSGDVAALAGVSQRTVSNVVNGYVHVRPETRERVQRAIDELAYRPNASARSLRDGRTGIVALAVPEIASPYFAELADQVQQAAAARGLTLLIDQTGSDRTREMLVLDGYRAHIIDGLLFSPSEIRAHDVAQRDVDTPTVLLGERIHVDRLVNVAIDNVAAAREATAHLIETGCRRVVAFGTEPARNRLGPAPRRLQGYRLALREAGIAADKSLVLRADIWTRAAGYEAASSMLDQRDDVDGFFCFSDMLALGAIRALTDRGIRVPEDVRVVGWDDIEQAAYATPSLTSVSPDKAEIAATAIDLLLAQIRGELSGGREVLCGHQLVIRGSTVAGG